MAIKTLATATIAVFLVLTACSYTPTSAPSSIASGQISTPTPQPTTDGLRSLSQEIEPESGQTPQPTNTASLHPTTHAPGHTNASASQPTTTPDPIDLALDCMKLPLLAELDQFATECVDVQLLRGIVKDAPVHQKRGIVKGPR